MRQKAEAALLQMETAAALLRAAACDGLIGPEKETRLRAVRLAQEMLQHAVASVAEYEAELAPGCVVAYVGLGCREVRDAQRSH